MIYSTFWNSLLITNFIILHTSSKCTQKLGVRNSDKTWIQWSNVARTQRGNHNPCFVTYMILYFIKKKLRVITMKIYKITKIIIQFLVGARDTIIQFSELKGLPYVGVRYKTSQVLYQIWWAQFKRNLCWLYLSTPLVINWIVPQRFVDVRIRWRKTPIKLHEKIKFVVVARNRIYWLFKLIL